MIGVRTGAILVPVFVDGEKRTFHRTRIIIGQPYTPVYTGRRGTAEEMQKIADDLLREVYALGGQQVGGAPLCKVILAESAGFCYGVKRAVELAQKTAEETSGCWMLGDLIHNTHVVNDLAARGIRKTDRPEALGAGDTVVIRSHGELKSVLDGLEARGVRCVNATCPNVIHIQELVSQAEREGRQVVIIGEPHHPEVHGTCQLVRSSAGVSDGPEAVTEWLEDGDFQPEMPVTHGGADHLYS